MAGVEDRIARLPTPVEAAPDKTAYGLASLQTEPELAQVSQGTFDHVAAIDEQLPTRLGRCLGIGNAVRLQFSQRLFRGLAACAEALAVADLLNRLVALERLRRVLRIAAVHAQKDRADRLAQALLVAGDGVALGDVGQHLVDQRARADQQAIGHAQYAAVVLADRRPDGRAVIFRQRLAVFQRDLPGQGRCGLAGFGLQPAQPLDLAQAIGGGPGQVALRLPGASQQELPAIVRWREGVQAPLQRDQRLRLLAQIVRPVHRHVDGAALVLEAEIALAPRFRHPEEGAGGGRETVAAVAAGQPALDHFELLADAGVVGHEHQATVGVEIGLGGRSPIRQASAHEARRPVAGDRAGEGGGLVARVGTADVRPQRAAPAVRVEQVVEVVDACAAECGQGLALQHLG